MGNIKGKRTIALIFIKTPNKMKKDKCSDVPFFESFIDGA